jgi:trans-aconitate methyltransferase
VLDESDRCAFLAAYATRISATCPKQPEGRTLLLFRRIFLIGRV